MNLPASFSLKTAIPRTRAFFSFARIIRIALIAAALFMCLALLLDIFIFYRYSYRVVNLNPESVTSNVALNRVSLREALTILDARAEKFKELYGTGTTTLPQ